MERDRDAAGRPRNARARDALGRPLPPAAGGGVEQVPEELSGSVAEAVELADGLLRAGRPFHAHEVFEALWKARPDDERELWQGLAQIAVGQTHALRGNARGAITLLRRGAARTGAYSGPKHGIEVDRMTREALALADRIERDGLPAADPTGRAPRPVLDGKLRRKELSVQNPPPQDGPG
jgi:hypothetical protein